jgi:hypothetical protein
MSAARAGAGGGQGAMQRGSLRQSSGADTLLLYAFHFSFRIPLGIFIVRHIFLDRVPFHETSLSSEWRSRLVLGRY